MSTKYIKRLIPFFIAVILVVLTDITVQAAATPSLEVGEVRSLGNKVKVPVTIVNTTYLTSGQVEIILPTNEGKVTLSKFEPTGVFDGKLFRTVSNISGNKVTIDFQSLTNKEHNLSNKKTVVGYLTYTLSAKFKEGESIKLNLSSVVAKGRSGADLILAPLEGAIERKMPIGDVVGKNKPTAASAMRILQHANGKAILDREAQLAADVDKDGKITQSDAQQILDYTTGKRTSFLAIAAQELDNGVLKSEYVAKVQAFHGREPYTYTRKSGTLPSGLTLNAQTGEITGVPTSAKSFTFTIQVTDAVGNIADRIFTMEVIDSNIISVEMLQPINVKMGKVPALPKEVTVTYKDKTTGKEPVQWGPVDTSVLGETVAKGTISNTGFKVNVPIHVVNVNYFNAIKVGYIQILNFHTITLEVNPEVYIVTVNGLNALYEGDNKFSIASNILESGSNVTIKAYDKYGNILETKMHQLVVN